MFDADSGFTLTGRDPNRPWIVLGREHQTVNPTSVVAVRPLRLRALVHARASQLCPLTLDRGSLARQARTRPLRSGQRVKPHAIKQRSSLRMMLGVPVVRAGRTQVRRLNIWHCLSLRLRNAKSRTSR